MRYPLAPVYAVISYYVLEGSDLIERRVGILTLAKNY